MMDDSRMGNNTGPVGTIGALVAATGLAAWFLVSATSQHPQRAFDLFRKYDPIGMLIPNWRFFAPEPAQHDIHVLYRVLTDEGGSSWEETFEIAPRRLSHLVWFPARRREKGMVDVVMSFFSAMGRSDGDHAKIVTYRLLRDAVEVAVRRRYEGRELPVGYQFALVRYTGYDESGTPDYMYSSRFERIDREEAAPEPAGGRR